MWISTWWFFSIFKTIDARPSEVCDDSPGLWWSRTSPCIAACPCWASHSAETYHGCHGRKGLPCGWRFVAIFQCWSFLGMVYEVGFATWMGISGNNIASNGDFEMSWWYLYAFIIGGFYGDIFQIFQASDRWHPFRKRGNIFKHLHGKQLCNW